MSHPGESGGGGGEGGRRQPPTHPVFQSPSEANPQKARAPEEPFLYDHRVRGMNSPIDVLHANDLLT